jgi:hypothetical protein
MRRSTSPSATTRTSFISAYRPVDDARLRPRAARRAARRHLKISPTEDVDAILRDTEEKARRARRVALSAR